MSGNSISADSHAQDRPKTTASKCVTHSVTATHNFEVADFSLLVGIGVGKFVGSTTFSVGGCDWNIRVYPDGSKTEDDNNGAYVSVYLYFRKGVAGVRVRFSLTILNKDGRLRERDSMLFMTTFESIGADWGYEKFMKKSKLQKFLRLNHDSFTVSCNLTVIGQCRSDEVEAVNAAVTIPPANLTQDLARMLKDGEGADVTFDVDGHLFSAHRCLLAARSPVFRALFFGPMKANAGQHIKIDDIEPAIFEALLRFIYTDSIRPGTCGGGDAREQDNVTSQHLLAAADQYGVDRLRLTCEARLCRGIDVLTVGTTLALAERHHCIKLKDACLEFIASHDMLGAIMDTDGFKHLLASCPFIMKEILEKIADARAGARWRLN